MAKRAMSMDAAGDNPDGAIRRLVSAMRHNCGVLTEALEIYPRDSPERWQVFGAIVPRYSEPAKSLVSHALVEGRMLKGLAVFSCIITVLTQSWDAMISAYPESKDATNDKWTAACYRLAVAAEVVDIVYEHFGGKA